MDMDMGTVSELLGRGAGVLGEVSGEASEQKAKVFGETWGSG